MFVSTQASSRICPHSFSPFSCENINPHSSSFSITHRLRRKRQRLPSSRVIESAGKDFGATPLGSTGTSDER
jgi:hypothetical protein